MKQSKPISQGLAPAGDLPFVKSRPQKVTEKGLLPHVRARASLGSVDSQQLTSWPAAKITPNGQNRIVDRERFNKQ